MAVEKSSKKQVTPKKATVKSASAKAASTSKKRTSVKNKPKSTTKSSGKKKSVKSEAEAQPVLQSTAVVLEKALAFANIGSLQSALSNHSSTEGEVTIDVEGLVSVDIASIQLITAFVQMLKSQSRDVAWQGISNDFAQQVALLDLDKHLGIDASQFIEAEEEPDSLCPVF
ncbi:MAG: STAS domain-containing protein [Pseudomonadales bacterium]